MIIDFHTHSFPDELASKTIPYLEEKAGFIAKTDGKIMYGELATNVKALAVKDSNGNHVFENSSAGLVPSSLIFAVPEYMHLLLRKAGYLNGELIPVPRNKSYSENPSATVVSSEYIQDYILSQTIILPEQVSNNNIGTIGNVTNE